MLGVWFQKTLIILVLQMQLVSLNAFVFILYSHRPFVQPFQNTDSVDSMMEGISKLKVNLLKKMKIRKKKLKKKKKRM